MFLQVLFFLFMKLAPPVLSLNREGLYLQQVKLGLDDPNGALSSWKGGGGGPCGWAGVTCDAATMSVTAVDLSNANVAGPFPAALCHLENLRYISLYNNSINTTLPMDVFLCSSLEHLDLAQNLLTGALPETLADLPSLRYLDLSGNNFSGEIPASFGRFRRLEVLSLVSNLLDGSLPAVLGNISTLRQLNASYNPFMPSPIPLELGNLTSLEILWLSGCNMVGRIPESLGRLKKLIVFDVAQNNLGGPIPSSLTELESVVQVELYNNSLTGMLLAGMANLTKLRRFDAAMNQLGGTIPDGLCQLPLESLNLYGNQFVGHLPGSIANSPNLYELNLFGNRLTGELPKDLGKNSPLYLVDFSSNSFSGEIPGSLCEMGALEELLSIHNSLSGPIPMSLGDCQTLTRIRLGYNRLSGDVPAALWGLPRIKLLELVQNFFTGEISENIRHASDLSVMFLSNNNFTGRIPEEMGQLRNLIEFSGNDNQFNGALPFSITKLPRLEKLDLHSNKLSGDIPPGIDSLTRLSDLNLASNEFSGEIPQEIGSLSSLNYLDLSRNRLSGKIPLQLQNLKLNRLNLSYNSLSGDIPPLFAKPVYKSSFLGNPGICGDSEGSCDGKDESKNQGYVWLLKSIFVLASLVFVLGVVWFYRKYRNFNAAERAIDGDKKKWTVMSFHRLGFSESEIIDCLDEENLIGSGASGKVYKAVLSNGEAVAVKKLWGRSKMADESGDLADGPSNYDGGFEAEVETLGNIRHKNIVKLWCSCTAKDSKLLVYEYMQNGSLGDVLHCSKRGILDWPLRYNVAVDAAEGLSYLHHDCVPPIVHRDVKSNNILLDGDFRARVADFGVAKAVDPTTRGPKSMSMIVGSRGYIAPEYAYTLRVNEKSDVYSFGVVILELVTGRSAVDPDESCEKDLAKWVRAALEQEGADGVLDRGLDACFRDEVLKVLNIGLLCTSHLPINRPAMRRVLKMLQEAGEERRFKAAKCDGKSSPLCAEDGLESW